MLNKRVGKKISKTAQLSYENKTLILMICMKLMNFCSKLTCWQTFSLEFEKRIAPNKDVLEGKISLELINMQHVY